MGVGKINKESQILNSKSETQKDHDPHGRVRHVPQFESAGILCRIPRWWRGGVRAGVSLSVGKREPSKVGIDALLESERSLMMHVMFS